MHLQDVVVFQSGARRSRGTSRRRLPILQYTPVGHRDRNGLVGTNEPKFVKGFFELTLLFVIRERLNRNGKWVRSVFFLIRDVSDSFFRVPVGEPAHACAVLVDNFVENKWFSGFGPPHSARFWSRMGLKSGPPCN